MSRFSIPASSPQRCDMLLRKFCPRPDPLVTGFGEPQFAFTMAETTLELGQLAVEAPSLAELSLAVDA